MRVFLESIGGIVVQTMSVEQVIERGIRIERGAILRSPTIERGLCFDHASTHGDNLHEAKAVVHSFLLLVLEVGVHHHCADLQTAALSQRTVPLMDDDADMEVGHDRQLRTSSLVQGSLCSD